MTKSGFSVNKILDSFLHAIPPENTVDSSLYSERALLIDEITKSMAEAELFQPAFELAAKRSASWSFDDEYMRSPFSIFNTICEFGYLSRSLKEIGRNSALEESDKPLAYANLVIPFHLFPNIRVNHLTQNQRIKVHLHSRVWAVMGMADEIPRLQLPQG